ncbi:MAG: hypothetical protein A2461_01895 [Burkholderiales bacterium RIFOXYC2_FULL_59_8]|nr:MAG: hypothetical protein A2461_01895 [Burkholderiales bacterium RIFOXYC2_FULL_59_8]OGB81717.1 MAG: hypothetical protein A2535_11960 [Burkholderiales bacterium RIFOXYD2_FULL_59_8]
MKSLFSVQRTRYTAAVMLFVWLMSLGIGLANACLVKQDHGPGEYFSQGRSGTDLAALAERQAARDHFTTNSLHSDANASSPEKITCLHFCAAEQSSLITDHSNGLAHLDLVPIMFLTGLPVPTTDQVLSAEAFASPSWSEPPVSIRYLRLTI